MCAHAHRTCVSNQVLQPLMHCKRRRLPDRIIFNTAGLIGVKGRLQLSLPRPRRRQNRIEVPVRFGQELSGGGIYVKRLMLSLTAFSLEAPHYVCLKPCHADADDWLAWPVEDKYRLSWWPLLIAILGALPTSKSAHRTMLASGLAVTMRLPVSWRRLESMARTSKQRQSLAVLLFQVVFQFDLL